MRDRSFGRKGMKPKYGKIVYTYTPPEVIKKAKELETVLNPRRRAAARRRQWVLGHTRPMPWLDSAPQGGNANPKRKKKEHPSGHHNCGFYRP